MFQKNPAPYLEGINACGLNVKVSPRALMLMFWKAVAFLGGEASLEEV